MRKKKVLLGLLLVFMFVYGGKNGLQVLVGFFSLDPKTFTIKIIIAGVCLLPLIPLGSYYQRVLNDEA